MKVRSDGPITANIGRHDVLIPDKDVVCLNILMEDADGMQRTDLFKKLSYNFADRVFFQSDFSIAISPERPFFCVL